MGWRSSVGVSGWRWRPAVMRVHDRARVRVAAHAWCGRVAAACGGRLKVKGKVKIKVKNKVKSKGQGRGLRRRLRGERPRSGGGGLRCLVADAACGCVCPGFPVASSPEGSRPVRWYQAGSHLLWWRDARLDTTGPVCLAAPADATGNPGQPHCGVRDPRATRWSAAAGSALCDTWIPPPHTWGCPGSLVAVGGPCQSFRTGGVQSGVPPPQQQRSDLIPPGRNDSVHGDDSDEGSGTRRPNTNRHPPGPAHPSRPLPRGPPEAPPLTCSCP